MNILDSLLTVYPKAKDCVNGHVGGKVIDEYDELQDDRYYRVLIYRCAHCGMSLGDVNELDEPLDD